MEPQITKRMRAAATVLANIDKRRAASHDDNMLRNVELTLIGAMLDELEALDWRNELAAMDAEMEAFCGSH